MRELQSSAHGERERRNVLSHGDEGRRQGVAQEEIVFGNRILRIFPGRCQKNNFFARRTNASR
jgi:hypothetical protein